jgi:pimeloyl-ACP methyl ester carboxylesterase
MASPRGKFPLIVVTWLSSPTVSCSWGTDGDWVTWSTGIRPADPYSCSPACRARACRATPIARVRLIGVDRPGYGLSDEQRGRTLLDWPDDVAALADHLGFERFAVVGISGGGPFAAACAWKIPERLVAVSLVSAMGPADASETIANMPWLNRLMLQIGKRSERLVSLPATALVGLARLRPEWFLAVLNAHLPAVDRATYVRPEVQAAIREDTAEALRSGGQGVIRDIVLLARPWGFSLHEIHVPMRLWHGTHDATVPLPIGHALATALPRCEAHFVPDTGHFLVMERWQQILTDLVQTDQ